MKKLLILICINFTLHALELNNEKVLDKVWQQRQDPKVWQEIRGYLTTKPKIIDDFAIAWKTARLVYFIGNFTYQNEKYDLISGSRGADFFDYGVNAALCAIKLKPNRVEGHYYYAINLGSYGLAKGIITSGIKAKDGIKALEKAQKIDPSYQYYGSSRVLGRYYQELPRIMGGDNKKAYELLNLATKNAADFSDNWLFLGRYYNSIGKYQLALDACNKAAKLGGEGLLEEKRYHFEAKNCIAQSHDKLI